MYAAPPSPDILPAMDETQPVIGPNRAGEKELADAVRDFIRKFYYQPYLTFQDGMRDRWRMIDEAWRSQMDANDLDLTLPEKIQAQVRDQLKAGTKAGDGKSAKFTPSVIHQQIDAIVNLGISLSWEDGIPVRAEKPETTYEHPLYNPVQQGVEAANEELALCARNIRLRDKYRPALGSFVKYGFAWAMADLRRETETVTECYPLGADPMSAHMAYSSVLSLKGRAPDSIQPDALGRQCAYYQETILKTFDTEFTPLDVDAVLVDYRIPCTPIERQPCPILRTHLTRWELRDNPYDPQSNPFGWLNVEAALSQTAQDALSQPDEAHRRDRMTVKQEQGQIPYPQVSEQQLWTCFPLLAIDPKSGKLDEGYGVDCVTCNGSKLTKTVVTDELGGTSEVTTDCPDCKGQGKVYPKAERYIVQFFGSMQSGGNCACLRLQRNPTAKDRVPLFFRAHLTEDTAGAIPVSKSEIALKPFQQLATTENQFRQSKDATIRRPWKKRIDGVAWKVDCNAPGATIPWESNPNEAERVEGNQFDETVTLIPYAQRMEDQVRRVYGVTDTLLGEIASGRRSASEMTLASDSAKMPLANTVDACNSILADWAQMHLDNWEVYGDRSLLQKRTGRTTWGKLHLFTQKAMEFLKKQALTQNIRYVLETTAMDPSMQAVRPTLWGECFKLMGIDIDPSALDGGMRKHAMDAMALVAKILGDGVLQPPSPDDPHDLYLAIFTEAYRKAVQDENDHWHQYPQNLPLLAQRIAMQQQLQQQQLMMQQMAMMQQQALAGPPGPGGPPDPRGNAPSSPPRPAQSPGQMTQQMQG